MHGDIGNKSFCCLSTLLDTEHVLTLLYRQFTSSPHKLVKVTFLSSNVGSDKTHTVYMPITTFIIITMLHVSKKSHICMKNWRTCIVTQIAKFYH